MIFIIVLAIVLGMLVANMFKEVCGCKNLIEGQVIINSQGCIRVARTQPIGLNVEVGPGAIPSYASCPSPDTVLDTGWCVRVGQGSQINHFCGRVSSETDPANWCSENCGAEVSTSNEGNCSVCCQTPEVESDIRH